MNSPTLAEQCRHRVLGHVCCLTCDGGKRAGPGVHVALVKLRTRGLPDTFFSTSRPNQERKAVWRKRFWIFRQTFSLYRRVNV